MNTRTGEIYELPEDKAERARRLEGEEPSGLRPSLFLDDCLPSFLSDSLNDSEFLP